MTHGLFPTTQWTAILSAQSTPELRREVLSSLVRSYSRPLFVFFRKKGLNEATAQDAVQSLWVQLMERDILSSLTPQKGRLRSFLRTAATHHWMNQHERNIAQKRGGLDGFQPETLEAAERLVADPSRTADEAFDDMWAQEVMSRALHQLASEHRATNAHHWSALERFFQPDTAPSYKEVAQSHQLSLPQLKTLLFRARQRFRELVREEIMTTVETPADADAEMEELKRVLSR